MANNIQISDLRFEEIRTNLTNYLKTTTTFKDYDFEGSGIRTLIDLLAYNTFYYGYYANMMANEMFIDTAKLENSLISLTKPLGYVLINSLSAYANVRLDNLSSTSSKISAFSKFSAYDANGSLYYFYNINDVSIETADADNRETNYFPIYEGKFLVYRQLVDVDTNKQQFLISGKEVDPRTIVVQVLRQGSDGTATLEKWDNYLVNSEVITGPNSKIFFIERKKNGYMVLFGKQSETEESFASIGSQILDTDAVFVSYLVSSGEAGNNISNFTFISDAEGQDILTPTTQVSFAFASKAGRSSPDLESVRFFAPKSFAKQNRLVTKGDYYALLNELGYGSGSSPDFDFKVFGGEEATPPYYGRVFVSIIDLNPADTQDFTEINQINEVMSIINSKSVISILPEYIPPIDIKMKLKVTGLLSGGTPSIIQARKSAITVGLNKKYGTKKYNNNFIQEDIKDTMRQDGPGVFFQDEKIFLYALMPATLKQNQLKVMNFKNKISNSAPKGNVIINLGSFTIEDFSTEKKLYRFNSNGQQDIDEPVGELNYETGVITLYQNAVTQDALVEVQVRAYEDNFYAKDEFVCYLPQSNIELTITSN